jgi:hypothetical protein
VRIEREGDGENGDEAGQEEQVSLPSRRRRRRH